MLHRHDRAAPQDCRARPPQADDAGHEAVGQALLIAAAAGGALAASGLVDTVVVTFQRMIVALS